SAATNRVFTAPASTETTTSSVASSVILRPSTCRFGMPAAASAASISRPPPCTTMSGAPRPAIAASAETTVARRPESSESSPPNLTTRGPTAVTATAVFRRHNRRRVRGSRFRCRAPVAAPARSQQPRALVEAEHDVHVLDRLAGGALYQVVDHGDDDHA